MKIKVLSRNIQFPRKFAFKQFVWIGWWVYYYHAALSSIDWHDHDETCWQKKSFTTCLRPIYSEFLNSIFIRLIKSWSSSTPLGTAVGERWWLVGLADNERNRRRRPGCCCSLIRNTFAGNFTNQLLAGCSAPDWLMDAIYHYPRHTECHTSPFGWKESIGARKIGENRKIADCQNLTRKSSGTNSR